MKPSRAPRLARFLRRGGEQAERMRGDDGRRREVADEAKVVAAAIGDIGESQRLRDA